MQTTPHAAEPTPERGVNVPYDDEQAVAHHDLKAYLLGEPGHEPLLGVLVHGSRTAVACPLQPPASQGRPPGNARLAKPLGRTELSYMVYFWHCNV